MTELQPIITRERIQSMTEEEKIHFTNIELFSDYDNPYVEENISMKPIETLWNDVSHKIKWVKKSKKSHPYFDYVYEGLIEVYGNSLGSDIMRIIMDIVEVEFHKLNGKRVDFFEIVYNKVNISLNQWRKLIDQVNIPLSNVSNTSLKIQRVREKR